MGAEKRHVIRSNGKVNEQNLNIVARAMQYCNGSSVACE